MSGTFVFAAIVCEWTAFDPGTDMDDKYRPYLMVLGALFLILAVILEIFGKKDGDDE